MIRILTTRESWGSAIGNAFDAVGKCAAILTTSSKELPALLQELFGGNLGKCVYVNFPDGDSAMLLPKQHEEFLKIGPDAYDEMMLKKGWDRKERYASWSAYEEAEKEAARYAFMMREAGLEVDHTSSDSSATYAKGEGFRFRALHYKEESPRKAMNELHIAVDKHFDRWANSTDFVTPLPSSAQHLRKIIDLAKQQAGYLDSYAFGKGLKLGVEE